MSAVPRPKTRPSVTRGAGCSTGTVSKACPLNSSVADGPRHAVGPPTTDHSGSLGRPASPARSPPGAARTPPRPRACPRVGADPGDSSRVSCCKRPVSIRSRRETPRTWGRLSPSAPQRLPDSDSGTPSVPHSPRREPRHHVTLSLPQVELTARCRLLLPVEPYPCRQFLSTSSAPRRPGYRATARAALARAS